MCFPIQQCEDWAACLTWHFISHTEDRSLYLPVLNICTLSKPFFKHLFTENISIKLYKTNPSHVICLLLSIYYYAIIYVATLSLVCVSWTKTYKYDTSPNYKQLFVIIRNSLCSWDHCQHPPVKPCRWCDWCHGAWDVVKGGCWRFNFIFYVHVHLPVNGKRGKNAGNVWKHRILLIKLRHSYKTANANI